MINLNCDRIQIVSDSRDQSLNVVYTTFETPCNRATHLFPILSNT